MTLLDINLLQQERTKLFRDVYFHNKIPERVPINITFSLEAIAEYGGVDIVAAQWDPALVEDAADKLCQIIPSDTSIFNGSMRFPAFYHALDSRSFVMGSNGIIQHPETIGMLPEDYDYLIEKPYDCLLERVLPRQYKELNLDDPINMSISLAKSLMGWGKSYQEAGAIIAKLTEKYGYYRKGTVTAGFTQAPFDFLADQLRSFIGICSDIRRMPEKVAEACEALYPIVLKKGLPAKITEQSTVFLPLHMPTFLREDDFAKLWWPSLKKMIDEYASMGIHATLFCEDDWTRYVDYLYDLPTDTVLMFEYGDMQVFKEKLGKKHIITGLYPMTMFKNSSKEKCLAKAEKMLDVLAPGGRYIFALDKQPLTIQDVNMDNLVAVAEYIRENGTYTNAGETSGLTFNKADYKAAPSRKLETKYYKTWEQFKYNHPHVSDLGAPMLQGFEEMIFQYLMFLLM